MLRLITCPRPARPAVGVAGIKCLDEVQADYEKPVRESHSCSAAYARYGPAVRTAGGGCEPSFFSVSWGCIVCRAPGFERRARGLRGRKGGTRRRQGARGRRGEGRRGRAETGEAGVVEAAAESAPTAPQPCDWAAARRRARDA